MSVTATASMIQREIDHGICLLTFDRPESGANLFDAATLTDLAQQLDFIGVEDSPTRIGLPETTLGLIPAWGGWTRLPRLIGAEKAAEVIVKGKLYSAQEAKQLGLVDEIVSHEKLLEAARKKLRDSKRPSPSPLPQGEADGAAAGEGKTSAPRANGNLASARAREVITKGLRGTVEDSLRM